MKRFLIYPAVAFAFSLTSPDSLAGGTLNQRPDVSVGKSEGLKRGDDIYNTNAAGQMIRLTGRRGQQMVFFFCIMNDGNADEMFSFKGTRQNRKFRINYFKVGGGKITSQVFNGNYVDFLQSPGDGIYVKTVARPKRKFHDRRVKITIKGRVQSQFDPSKIDCAKALFRNKP